MIDVRHTVKLADDFEERKQNSLKELLKNKDIYMFIQQNHISYETYSDYWSELLSFEEDHHLCRDCQSIEQCPKTAVGMQYHLDYDGEILLSTRPCQYGEQYQHNQRILSHYLFNNMSDEYAFIKLMDLDIMERASTLSANTAATLMKVLSYVQKKSNKGLYVSGHTGSGKTTILCGLLNSLAEQGYDVGICRFPQFLFDLKAGFNSDSNTADMSELMTIPYLLIDGLGEENITTWSRDEVLSTIINYRDMNHLPTFISSIYSLDELKKLYTLRKKDPVESLKTTAIIEKIKNMCDELMID
ncbi:MAG: ATP-binding protein [Erysipelotrichaceae bacterium]|nr:ATP-binding protein [Erysipelotrichaceae bacterium]